MPTPDLFQAWAPPNGPWSEWAKPVLFATAPLIPCPPGQWLLPPEFPFPACSDTAAVIDLPREFSVAYGIAAAKQGFAPIPLYNCLYHTDGVLHLTALLMWLGEGGRILPTVDLPATAPPAFLLDSKRLRPESALLPLKFDNRYVNFPQDFPSGGLLKSRGISRIVVAHEPSLNAPFTRPGDQSSINEDLSHVLSRWQEAGLEMLSSEWDRATNSMSAPEPFTVRRPSYFRSLLYRLRATSELTRSNIGGFGGLIPTATTGG
jgi:hypothetical protein